MSQKSLSHWLKVILVGLALCGAVVYALVIPEAGKYLVSGAPELAPWYWPWLIFAWITAIPCCAVLVLGWKIAVNIGADRSFTLENALLLKRIALWAAGDSALVFVWNLVCFFITGMNHPAVALLLLLVVFVGVAISIAAAALSHLVRKAADLQEQSDWTV